VFEEESFIVLKDEFLKFERSKIMFLASPDLRERVVSPLLTLKLIELSLRLRTFKVKGSLVITNPGFTLKSAVLFERVKLYQSSSSTT
jgi:hypothetical protein